MSVELKLQWRRVIGRRAKYESARGKRRYVIYECGTRQIPKWVVYLHGIGPIGYVCDFQTAKEYAAGWEGAARSNGQKPDSQRAASKIIMRNHPKSEQRANNPKRLASRTQAFKATSEALDALNPLDAAIIVKALVVIWL